MISFWKRKEKITRGTLGPLLMPPIPPRKEFETMLEILRDAEKFDNNGEKSVSNSTLRTLCEFIEVHIAKNSQHCA